MKYDNHTKTQSKHSKAQCGYGDWKRTLLHFACLMSDAGHVLEIVPRQSASELQLLLPEVLHCAKQCC